MSIIVNGTTITKVVVNGQEMSNVKVNNTSVFSKSVTPPPPPPPTPTNDYVWREFYGSGMILSQPSNEPIYSGMSCESYEEGSVKVYGGTRYRCEKK